MKNLSLLYFLTLHTLLSSAARTDSASVFRPALFANAGMSLTSYNQSVLETKANPFIDLEYQVSSSLSPVFHYNRLNGYTFNTYYPRLIRQSLNPSTANNADTFYDVNEAERLNMNCYTLKFKFKLYGSPQSFGYVSPQLGFIFAKNKRELQGSNYYALTKSTEMFYSYGADLGLDQQISIDGMLRLTLCASLLIGNSEEKDYYNYSSKLRSHIVVYQVSAGLKLLLYRVRAT